MKDVINQCLEFALNAALKLQALVYADILSSTTAVFSYTIGSRKLEEGAGKRCSEFVPEPFGGRCMTASVGSCAEITSAPSVA